MSGQTATVQTLAAEVRVLMVGSRQVTLSVFHQLDTVPLAECEVFGRVNASKDDTLWVVGRDPLGALVKARAERVAEHLRPHRPDLNIQTTGWARARGDWKSRSRFAIGSHSVEPKHRYWGSPDSREPGSWEFVTSELEALVLAEVAEFELTTLRLFEEDLARYEHHKAAHDARVEKAEAAPLIVLAGLR